MITDTQIIEACQKQDYCTPDVAKVILDFLVDTKMFRFDTTELCKSEQSEGQIYFYNHVLPAVYRDYFSIDERDKNDKTWLAKTHVFNFQQLLAIAQRMGVDISLFSVRSYDGNTYFDYEHPENTDSVIIGSPFWFSQALAMLLVYFIQDYYKNLYGYATN